MAKRIHVQLEGFEELSRTFNSLARGVQGKIIRPALREGAKIVRDEAARRVPVDTGRLRKSLKVRALKRSRKFVGFQITTGTQDELGIKTPKSGKRNYYPFVIEYGGVVGGTARKVRIGRRTRVVKDGGRRIPARPFLRPAVDANRDRVMLLLAKRLQAGIWKAIADKGRGAFAASE